MLRKKSFYIITIIIGLCLVGLSFFIQKEDLKAISGICMGIGAGLFGMSAGNLIVKCIEEKDPSVSKQIEIEYRDERNIQIRNRAKAKAGDITQFFIIGVAYLTILIDAPLWVTLVTIGVFLVYNILGVYFMNKYNKE